MGDAPRTNDTHGPQPARADADRAPALSLERRLDNLAEQTGVGRGAIIAGGAAVGLAAGVAGAVPMADGFSRAVAARRGSMAAKISAGALGGAGVLAFVVLLGIRLSQPPPPAARTDEELREPSVWNLRRGVADPALLDKVPALNPVGSAPTARPTSDAAKPTPVGVSPSSWPSDVRP